MSGKPAGKRVKIVRKELADGTVKEYRYDRQALARKKFVSKNVYAIKQIAMAYYRSPEFMNLSPRWQRATRYYVGIIDDALGWASLPDIAKRAIRKEFYSLRDAHAAYPAKADKVMNVLRCLLNFAYERDMIDANHAHEIPRLTSSGAVRADKVWTPDYESAFIAVARPCVQRLYWFALYSAARQSDICRLTWEMMDRDGWLTFKPSKTAHSTGAIVSLPTFALPPLHALLEALPGRTGPILLTDDGLPWKPDNIKREWRVTKARAGLAEVDITFHDIRGTSASRMLESGCSEAEVSAVTGHSLVKGSGLRSYAARSRRLALNAYRRWGAFMAGEAEVVEIGNRRLETGGNQPPRD